MCNKHAAGGEWLTYRAHRRFLGSTPIASDSHFLLTSLQTLGAAPQSCSLRCWIQLDAIVSPDQEVQGLLGMPLVQQISSTF